MRRSTLTAALLTAIAASSGGAQLLPDVDPGRSERTRTDLEGLLAYYEQVLASPVYSASVKESVRANVERIRSRLLNGDFRAGDRIELSVEGEPELPDTVSVQSGPLITLPLFGEIGLAGVLRSEIEAHLETQLGRFIRDPVVRARALMRISVLGAVRAPGFYTVPADMLLSETLMVAGGPDANARVEQLRVERGVDRVLGGEQLQEAMRDGLTLDQLNLQAGDQIVMPARGGGTLTNVAVIVGIAGSIGLLIIQLAG